jgi:hypothetical protein
VTRFRREIEDTGDLVAALCEGDFEAESWR